MSVPQFVRVVVPLLLTTSLAVAPGHAALAAPGELDTTFGGTGMVTTDFGKEALPLAVAIDSAGGIVAAGRIKAGRRNFDFSLAKYKPNGKLDTSFGGTGMVTTAFSSADDQVFDVASQIDGKVVAAGYTAVNRKGTKFGWGIARYLTDGSLDPGFGDGGEVVTRFGATDDEALAVVIQTDGKILASGCTDCLSPTAKFALARYQTNGLPDPSFGTNGKVVSDVGPGADEATSVAVRSDGSIVAGGCSECFFGGDSDFILARYTAGGVLDQGFGTGGVVITDFSGGSDGISKVLIDANDRILAGGVAFGGVDFDIALARYSSQGTPDQGFGTGGKVTTDFGSGDDFSGGLAVQADGKIVQGATSAFGVTATKFSLVRYLDDGKLDRSFGSGGKVVTDFGSSIDTEFDIAMQADGKVVAAGSTLRGRRDVFALARYLTS
jgi:uncharacterized delta-60 repeat protein